MEVSGLSPLPLVFSCGSEYQAELFCSLWTISSNTHPPFTSLLRELLMGMTQHSSPFFPNYLICSIGFIEKGEEGKQKVSGKLK